MFPHSVPEHELLAANTPAEKRAWMERYAGLLQACDDSSRVQADLLVDGKDHVSLNLSVVPDATCAGDRLGTRLARTQHANVCMNAVVQDHLRSMGSTMHGMMAIAQPEASTAAHTPAVPCLTGGASLDEGLAVDALTTEKQQLLCGASSQQRVHGMSAVRENGMSAEHLPSQDTESSDMAHRCEAMLSMIDGMQRPQQLLTPGAEVSNWSDAWTWHRLAGDKCHAKGNLCHCLQQNKAQKPSLLLVYAVCVLGDSCMLMCSLHMQASGLTSNTGTALSPISLQTATTMRVERLLANVWGMLQLEEPFVPHADSASDLAQEVRPTMLLLKTQGPDQHAVNAPCFGNVHAPSDLICYVLDSFRQEQM